MHSTCILDDGYMGSGKRLRNSIRKYGPENHSKEILEYFDTRELLIEAEKNLITSDVLCDVMCMNIMSGGTGGFISVEQQRYRSECGGKARAQKLKNDIEYYNNFIKISSESFKKAHKEGKIKYDTFTGKKHSEETKQLMSESSKGMGIGKANSQYGTCWITKDGLNKKINKEELDKWIGEGWIKGRKLK